MFGDRWLLPLTLTGSGALRPFDIEILTSYGIVVTPSSKYGYICYVDYTRFPKSASSQLHLEVQFYLATVLPCDIAYCVIVRRGERPAMNLTKAYFDGLNSVAMKMTNLFVVQVYEEGHGHLLDFLGFQQRRVSQANFPHLNVTHVSGHSTKSTLEKLFHAGFDRCCLLRELGGRVDPRTMDDWIRNRQRLEHVMWESKVLKFRLGLPHSKKSRTSTELTQQRHILLQRRPGETYAEFKKRRNSAYSRRCYHRLKLEHMQLQEELDEEEAINRDLQREIRG